MAPPRPHKGRNQFPKLDSPLFRTSKPNVELISYTKYHPLTQEYHPAPINYKNKELGPQHHHPGSKIQLKISTASEESNTQGAQIQPPRKEYLPPPHPQLHPSQEYLPPPHLSQEYVTPLPLPPRQEYLPPPPLPPSQKYLPPPLPYSSQEYLPLPPSQEYLLPAPPPIPPSQKYLPPPPNPSEFPHKINHDHHNHLSGSKSNYYVLIPMSNIMVRILGKIPPKHLRPKNTPNSSRLKSLQLKRLDWSVILIMLTLSFLIPFVLTGIGVTPDLFI